MVRQDASGSPAPAPPEGFMEYLQTLSQNGLLLPLLQPQPPPTPDTSTTTSVSLPSTSAQGRSFSRPNHGTGGVLLEKQKISKEITAPATKRKSLVDLHVEAEGSLMPVVPGTVNPRQTKRQKVTKVKVL